MYEVMCCYYKYGMLGCCATVVVISMICFDMHSLRCTLHGSTFLYVVMNLSLLLYLHDVMIQQIQCGSIEQAGIFCVASFPPISLSDFRILCKFLFPAC